MFLADHAHEQTGLDYVLFMPTMNPPHKTDIDLVSAKHRLNMVSLAIEKNDYFILSDFELNRPGITYTSDTLKILKDEEPDTEFYFIVGADSLMMMSHWKDPHTVFQLSTVVAGVRNDHDSDQLIKQAEYLKTTYNGDIILLDMPIMEISSEKIRERVVNNKSIQYYVPYEVYSYIKDHNLYK